MSALVLLLDSYSIRGCLRCVEVDSRVRVGISHEVLLGRSILTISDAQE